MTARFLAMTVMVAVLGGHADAQELASDLSQLRVLVKPGDVLTVTDAGGQKVRGRLTRLDDSGIVLALRDNQTRQFDGQVLMTIEKRGGDSLKNGALIGLATGGIVGVLGGVGYANAYDGNYAAWALAYGLVYGGLGTAIGTGIDALITGNRVVFAKSRTTISIAPVLDRHRKGVVFALRR